MSACVHALLLLLLPLPPPLPPRLLSFSRQKQGEPCFVRAHLNASDAGAYEPDIVPSLESAQHPVFPGVVASHVCDGVLEGILDDGSLAVNVVPRDEHRRVMCGLSLRARYRTEASLAGVPSRGRDGILQETEGATVESVCVARVFLVWEQTECEQHGGCCVWCFQPGVLSSVWRHEP